MWNLVDGGLRLGDVPPGVPLVLARLKCDGASSELLELSGHFKRLSISLHLKAAAKRGRGQGSGGPRGENVGGENVDHRVSHFVLFLLGNLECSETETDDSEGGWFMKWISEITSL